MSVVTRVHSTRAVSPGRMLLIHPGALGDLVQAVPAVAAVRAAYPGAELTLLTDAGLTELVESTGLVDRIVGLDAATAYRGSRAAKAALLARLAFAVRRVRPDAAAVFKAAPVYAALALASGARVRVGLTRGIGRRLLTHPLAVDPSRHREDRYFDVAAALGAAPGSAPSWTWPPAPAPGRTIKRETLRIGIAPGGARNAKEEMPVRRWPADRFAELAAALAADYPTAHFVLLGAHTDAAEVATVEAAVPPGRVTNLAGRTDLFAARAAIATLDVFVANDSGLMHLAGTTDAPTVAVFGPTDPRVAAPRTPGTRTVWCPAPGPPCHDEVRGGTRPCRTPCCIERVSVRQVRVAVHAALGAGTPAAPAAV